MATNMKIVMTPQDLVDKLASDLEQILRLRDDTHYKAGCPEEMDEEYGEIPETWAQRVYDNNNRMGGYLADAEKIVAALKRYVYEMEGE